MQLASLKNSVKQHQCLANAQYVDDIQKSEIEMQFIMTRALYKLHKDEQALKKIAFFFSFCDQNAGLVPFKIKYMVLKCKIMLR